jgi:hypothetical protein
MLCWSVSDPHADGDTAQAGEATVATAASHAVRGGHGQTWSEDDLVWLQKRLCVWAQAGA